MNDRLGMWGTRTEWWVTRGKEARDEPSDRSHSFISPSLYSCRSTVGSEGTGGRRQGTEKRDGPSFSLPTISYPLSVWWGYERERREGALSSLPHPAPKPWRRTERAEASLGIDIGATKERRSEWQREAIPFFPKWWTASPEGTSEWLGRTSEGEEW